MFDVFLLLAAQAFACIIFLAALNGWGAVVRQVLWAGLEPGFFPAAGTAILVVIGGPLVWAGVANSTLLVGLLVIGLLATAIEGWSVRRWFSKVFIIRRWPVLLLFSVFFFVWLCPLFASSLGGFHKYADKVGYAVNVVRLTQCGTYGPDPFNSRIIESSLGGFNFLLGLAHSAGLNLYQLRVVERFIAPVIILMSVWSFACCLRTTLVQRFLMTSSSSVIIYLGVGMGEGSTLTGTFVAVPLYLLFMRWLHQSATPVGPRAIFVGAALVAAICAIKSTHIVSFGLFAPIAVLAIPKWDLKERFAVGAITAATAFVVMVPYMANMHISSGTWLYPFFGNGFHGSSYGIYYQANLVENLAQGVTLKQLVSTALPIFSLLIFGLAYTRLKSTQHVCFGFSPLFLGLAQVVLCVGALLLVAKTGYGRYAFTGIAMTSLLLVLEMRAIAFVFRRHKVFCYFTTLMLFALMLTANVSQGLRTALADTYLGIGQRGKFPEPVTREDVLAAQAKVPVGATILVRMGQAYFLDFSRNPIWHIDLPGAACPPPGLPLTSGSTPKELVAYLRKIGIDYLIYSEVDDGGHPITDFGERAHKQEDTLWAQRYTSNIIIFDKLIRGLKEEGSVVLQRRNGLAVFNLNALSEISEFQTLDADE